jgi:hypothetical protein
MVVGAVWGLLVLAAILLLPLAYLSVLYIHAVVVTIYCKLSSKNHPKHLWDSIEKKLLYIFLFWVSIVVFIELYNFLNNNYRWMSRKFIEFFTF